MPLILCFAILFFSIHFHLNGQDTSLEVRILQPIIDTVPGQVCMLQAEIINRKCHPHILVAHLELPPLWEAVPSNDILLHINGGQIAIQTLQIKAPETSSAGEYDIAYTVWVRDNPSIVGRDTASIVIGDICPDSPIALEITSDRLVEVNSGEVVYVSALASNRSRESFEGHVNIAIPDQWQCTPSGKIPIFLEPEESKLLIYGIKVPPDALAGEHTLTLCYENHCNSNQSIVAVVKPKIEISGSLEGICEAFNINQMAPLYVKYTNKGNVPIRAFIETNSQPDCEIQYSSESFEILPGDSCEIPILVKPDTCENEFSQFLLLKLIDADSGEQLYQNPMTLKFVIPGTNSDDRYLHIPAYFKTMVLGNRDKVIFAGEFAGGGFINPKKERYLDFFFRVPTDSHFVIYNIDQRLYCGLYDPEWELKVGDTVYELSPLTQRFRYGRGAGFNYYQDTYEGGIHYTQNTLNCDDNPRELCSYLQYNCDDMFSISTNYLHRVQSCIPTSNILTLRSVINYPDNFVTDIEVGKNFLAHKQNDTWAYRFETRGKLWNNSWFSLEKAYAGSRFYGYYSNLHLLSSSLDFPLGNRWRLNLNINRFRQEIPCDCNDDDSPTIPRQNQYSANLTYSINHHSSFSINTLWLRGDDLGENPQYDFYQKWGGFSFFTCCNGYNFNLSAQYGSQRDYLKHSTSSCLQKYYAYLSKDFSPNLRGSVFYDSGNINYYDAKPWSIGYGGSLSYRFNSQGNLDLFIQRIKHTSDKLNLSQFTLNFNYTFKNLHRLNAMAQCYFYKSHYPNDHLFIISYSIPFQIPVCRNQEVGDLEGCLYNAWDDSPVADAFIQCEQNHATTDSNGRFDFRNICTGEQTLKLLKLPDDLISAVPKDNVVCVPGGSKVNASIPVVPACSIRGKITLYGYKDLFAMLTNPDNDDVVPIKGLAYIRVAIASDDDEEILSCLTNDQGIFEFAKLRPGNWYIKIYTDQIPPLHILDMNHLVVNLQPRENKTIEYKVQPKAPQIFKIDNN